MVLLGPAHSKHIIIVNSQSFLINNTRHFLGYEDKKIRAWNKAAKEFGIGHYRKNKYTGRTPF